MATVFDSVRSQFTDPARSRDFRLVLAVTLAVLAGAVVFAQASFVGASAGVSPDAPGPAAVSSANLPRVAVKPAGLLADDANVEAMADVVAKKYRISSHATRELVHAAYAEARQNRLDPLLLIAVIAVESRFNPIAQSEFGATGLMQVIPRYHSEKFSASNGESVLDPRTNIRVGAQALKEYVTRGGNETAGLQLYNGSSRDSSNAYATRVLTERARLQDAMAQSRARQGLQASRSQATSKPPVTPIT